MAGKCRDSWGDPSLAPPPPDHLLARLRGERLGPGRLVVLVGQTNRVGAQWFQLFLADQAGQRSREPLLSGLCNSGDYPATNWVEVTATTLRVEFPDGTEVELDQKRRQRLLTLLVERLPWGGHLMCEYESPEQAETLRALGLGVPPVLTPLGFLMFMAGCDGGFRDWYIPEGWSEGPRKLQGFKALGLGHAREKGQHMAEELHRFIASREGKRYLEETPGALDRAAEVLSLLPLEDPALIAGLGAALGRLGAGRSRKKRRQAQGRPRGA
jgi:hypothetical protein